MNSLAINVSLAVVFGLGVLLGYLWGWEANQAYADALKEASDLETSHRKVLFGD